MNLKEYRKATGCTFAWIGRQLGKNVRTIDNWARGVTNPSWTDAGTLEELTGGMVDRAQWYPPSAGKRIETGAVTDEPSHTVT